MAQRTEQRGETAEAPGGGRPDAPAPDLVPSRRQYLELKAQHPQAILLYRLGDFYETFDDDARVVARDARITLTTRSFGRSGRVPMAGIPHHALTHFLGRLLAAGHTVAIAEQITPAGRGLVERAVTRVLTPGTVAEPGLLPAGENRYLAAVHPLGGRIGLGWVDVSTGEFGVLELDGPGAGGRLAEELARLNPAECLVPDSLEGGADDPAEGSLDSPGGHRVDIGGAGPDGLPARLPAHLPGHRARLERWHFEPSRAADALCRRFGARSLAPYGCADLPAATGAAGAILVYLERTNPALLPLLTGLRTEPPGGRVGLDAATRRNLELTRSLGTGGSRGSLLGVLDGTRTAMGARALRRLVGQPLRDLPELRRRQRLVAALAANPANRTVLAASLAAVGDLERLVGRVTMGQAGARDFLALAAALRLVPEIAARLPPAGNESPGAEAGTPLDPCADVLVLLESAIEDDADDGARLRPGFCGALDAALAAAHDTRVWLAGLERAERTRTGIRSLKVGYTKVFGYYIEVTRPNLSLVPAEYSRKQTVAAGERFVTAPLKDAEARSLAADEEIAFLERAALVRLGAAVGGAVARLAATAAGLARLDALLALAEVAARAGWVAPELTEDDALEIVGGRHPVVEAGLAGDAFIPNACRMGGTVDGAPGEEAPRQIVVTGPNMGGKSTYLRQVALIALLAQIGSFVPAARARIGLVDRIFTRVGAQDDLARGHSTFMVEMVETATILHQATRHSLLILDEVGRGTATADGLAIARAVLEDIHGRIGARTLFATHYLELAALAERLPGVANAHVAALEADGRVVFLYAVRPGPADRAYGIQVARLAGLPPWVADRAEAVLASLAAPHPPASDVPAPPVGLHPLAPDPPTDRLLAEGPAPPYQLSLAGIRPAPNAADRLARELRDLDLDALTPRQAIDWLFAQRDRLW
ncbi:MAG: DNA mismatch repair protein MutS [uncultured Thermomicrobiales bacterium]|uniref:DNA mismatch repair protein MutS n=1 Tax=uncultured Thermomicrobiales bacterium TaxID=1645740 RepID=A0A6J4VFZ8_9BACT|nr:MAG: DNA mismatch repair protein MutS [uncultured Thermomicrobiales bacterium]